MTHGYENIVKEERWTSSNVFQNAEILGKKKSQAAYVGFHHILSQDPKDF